MRVNLSVCPTLSGRRLPAVVGPGAGKAGWRYPGRVVFLRESPAEVLGKQAALLETEVQRMPVRCPPASAGIPLVWVGVILLAVPDPGFLCECPRRGDSAPGRPRTPGSGDRCRRIRDRCSGSSAYTRQRGRDRACPQGECRSRSPLSCAQRKGISRFFSAAGRGPVGMVTRAPEQQGFLPCEREKNIGPSFEM
jgi:hypothetical protein